MKKGLIALLALLLCLTLPACGKQKTDAPDVPDTPTVDPAPAPPEQTPEQLAEQRLNERIAGMTLEEKVGQLFFVRCPETDVAEDVATYHLGGLLLFGRDYKDAGGVWLSEDAFTATLSSYQAAADLPLFIGSDEEGGTVVRVSANPDLRDTRFSSPQKLYAEGGLDRIRSDTEEKDALLLSLGINVNLAPVCDISSDPSSFIYPRTLGQDAETTSDYIRTVVGQMKSDGIGMVLKHFPGYGGSADTHTGQALDPRPLSDFEKNDLLPFEAGIDAGAQAVLVSHNIVACLDADYPASPLPYTLCCAAGSALTA